MDLLVSSAQNTNFLKIVHLYLYITQTAPLDGNMRYHTHNSIVRVIMAESVENSGADKMTITVKTPKEKHDIQIDTKATVKEVRFEYI